MSKSVNKFGQGLKIILNDFQEVDELLGYDQFIKENNVGEILYGEYFGNSGNSVTGVMEDLNYYYFVGYFWS